MFLVFIKFYGVPTALSISAAKPDPIFWFEPEFRLDFWVLSGRALKVKKAGWIGSTSKRVQIRVQPKHVLSKPD